MPETGSQMPLVVIGLSARMLAASAARAGLEAVAIDLFGDRDTRAVARCIAVSALDESQVLPALNRVVEERGRPRLVYGGGIDTRPGLVERISELTDLTGNPPAVLRTLNDPRSFFGLLDSLRIPYPEIRFNRPANPDAWLFKVPFTEGGRGIFSGWTGPRGCGGYYQRKLEGPAMSVSFLANRREVKILGFNTQWTRGPNARSPYRFSGIMNCAELTTRQKRELEEYAATLVESVALVGLNSLDFLIEDDICKVLELNPRPGMSLMLYESLFPHGVLAEHIQAVRGLAFSRANPEQLETCGLEIVYAGLSCVIQEDFWWPDWTVDRPMPGTLLAVDEPLCTVTAKARSGEVLRAVLSRRSQMIHDRISELARNKLC